MLSGVSITCFTASYAIVLALELTRLLFRSGIRGAVLLGFAGAGLLAHTIYLGNRAIHAAGSPVSSQKDWYLVAAWVLVAAYLYLTACHRKTALGVFVLPLVLGLVGVAAFVADEKPLQLEQASRVWGLVHGISILLATVAVSVGFVFGLMYLLQARMLRRKLPPLRGLRLPSLEWLQRSNGRAIVMSAPLMAVGVLSGMVLNLFRESERMPWRDPLTLATLLMFVWLTAVAGASLFYKPARQGRKVAYLTIASFAFLIFALSVGLFADTSHGRPGPSETQPPNATSASPISGEPIALGEPPREVGSVLRPIAGLARACLYPSFRSRVAATARSCGRQPADHDVANDIKPRSGDSRGADCCRRFAALRSVTRNQPTAYAVGYVLAPLRGCARLVGEDKVTRVRALRDNLLNSCESSYTIAAPDHTLTVLRQTLAVSLRDATLRCANRNGAPTVTHFLPHILQSGCPSSLVAGGIA